MPGNGSGSSVVKSTVEKSKSVAALSTAGTVPNTASHAAAVTPELCRELPCTVAPGESSSFIIQKFSEG